MIRAATPNDIPQIWRLIKELADYERLSDRVTGSPEALSSHLFKDRLVACLVLEEKGEIIGYALTYRTYSTFLTLPGVWLEDIYVTPSFRGKGFGKALLTHVVQSAKDSGAGRVEWSVLDWNEPSIQFYQAFGATVMPDWRICRMELG